MGPMRGGGQGELVQGSGQVPGPQLRGGQASREASGVGKGLAVMCGHGRVHERQGCKTEVGGPGSVLRNFSFAQGSGETLKD